MSPKYQVRIVRRDGLGQINDDYHATVSRLSDGVPLIWISRWRWLLERKIRRKALDRAFADYDKHRRQLGEVEVLVR